MFRPGSIKFFHLYHNSPFLITLTLAILVAVLEHVFTLILTPYEKTRGGSKIATILLLDVMTPLALSWQVM